MSTDCAREMDVIRSAATGSWDPELRDHVAACASCAEAFELASILHADDAEALKDAKVPAAGLMWWRATIRARAEAARTAEQPITIVQGVAGSCTVAAGCALAAYAWKSVSWPVVELTAAQYAVPLMLGLAFCLLVAPVAVYVALARD
jgi:hypothetical protein